MAGNQENRSRWQGKNLRVEIPFSRAGVAHHVWVGSEQSSILFDAGDGILRDLLTLGISPQQIDAIFITHGHYDHMGGLHSLLGFMRMIGRSKPLPVYMPEGCQEARRSCESFEECYAVSTPFDIEIVDLSLHQQITISDISVVPYPVVHCGSIVGGEILDPIPAVGYRISLGNETVAISGDTGDCDSLRELVKDVDLAIIEATYLSSSGKDNRLLRNVHLSEDLARGIGAMARDYILVHQGGRNPENP